MAHLVGDHLPRELSGKAGVFTVPSCISYLNQSRGAVGESPPGCGPDAATYIWGGDLPGEEAISAESQKGAASSLGGARGGTGKVHWDAAPFLTDPSQTEVKYRVASHSSLEEASGLSHGSVVLVPKLECFSAPEGYCYTTIMSKQCMQTVHILNTASCYSP